LPGIRLEAVREGAEDYEYYRILFNLVAKSDGRNDKSARDALQAAKDFVSIPNAGGTHSFSIMPDPDAIYRVRAAIVAERRGCQSNPMRDMILIQDLILWIAGIQKLLAQNSIELFRSE